MQNTKYPRIIYNLTNGNDSHILSNNIDAYYSKLREAYLDIKKEDTASYKYFAFVTLCASTLEFSLNQLIIDYCLSRYGLDEYKSYSEIYIKIPFKQKLELVPHIVTDSNYAINKDVLSYKVLAELITLRNKLVHGKEFLDKIKLPQVDLENKEGGIINFEVDIPLSPIESISKENCLRYGDAIGDFKKSILVPYFERTICANSLLKLVKDS